MKHKLLLTLIIGTFFCLIGWTVNAQRSTLRATWEYKSIGVSGPYWEEDGRQAGGNPMIVFYPRVRQLGDEGWELVSASSAGETGLMTLWFKRQK